MTEKEINDFAIRVWDGAAMTAFIGGMIGSMIGTFVILAFVLWA